MISHFIAYLLACFIILTIYILTGEIFVLGLVILLLAFFAVQLVYNLILAGRMDIDVNMKNSSISDKCVRISLDIKNSSHLPALKGVVKFRIVNSGFAISDTLVRKFSVKPGGESIVYELGSDYCGRFDVKIDYVRIYDFLGMTYRSVVKKLEKPVYLYPQMGAVHSVSEVRKVNYEKERFFSHQKNANLSEILQYRDYQPGDNLRHINWKLSDRYGELLVREFDTPTDNQVLLTFDTCDKSKLTKSLVYSALLSVSAAYVRSGIFHQIGWYRETGRKQQFRNMYRMDDIYMTMRMIFDDDSFTGTSGMAYLLRSGVLAKYAKVVYICDDIKPSIIKELELYGNVQIVLLDEQTVGEYINKPKTSQVTEESEEASSVKDENIGVKEVLKRIAV